MKAFYAGLVSNVPLNTIRDYLYNCNRKPWEIEYYIPVTGLSDVQVYIDFGSIKAVTVEIRVVNLCNLSAAKTSACRYVLGVASDGRYYGVFRFAGEIPIGGDFNDDYSDDFDNGTNATVPEGSAFIFALALDVTMQGGSVRRYFTEGYSVETCEPPMKIEACFPVHTNDLGYDTNDIYYGYTVDPSNSIGNRSFRYLHYVHVRQARVFEDAPKVTFSANIRQNFKTVLNRIYELRTELVPNWYKEYLLAVYARGFIQVSDAVYQVSDLALEGINDDDYTWKPYAKLKKETRYYFGCDNTPCDNGCPSPCGDISAIVETIHDPCDSPEGDSVHATVESITDAHFAETTFVSGDDLHDVEKANIEGIAGSVVTVKITLLNNNNGGQLFVNNSPSYMGNTFDVLLDSNGQGYLDVEIRGVHNPGTIIRAVFAITSVSSGGIGDVSTYQISKFFT